MRHTKNNIIKTALLLTFSSHLLFSCAKKEDLDAKRTELLGKDMRNLPQAMKINDVQTQDFAKLKAQMYTEGCKAVGSAAPALKPHPKLMSGHVYMVKSSRVEGKNKFQLNYDLKLNTQPSSTDSTIVLQGQIHEVSLSNFLEASFKNNDKSIQKKCAIMGIGSETENCYDLEINYSKEFVNQYNTAFKSDLDCEFGATDEAPIENWIEGQYVLQNSKSIKIYAQSVQTKLNRACVGENGARKVVKTVTRVSSNDVVSKQFSYCGGELVYEKQILRDYKTNEIISDQTYELLVAPIITTP
jgi:hypothetical protein